MTEAASISVALCTRNGALFVAEQLESIFGQSRLPDELVIVDDASTDATVDVIRAVLDQRLGSSRSIKIDFSANAVALGVTRNFEVAVSRCTGELIALSDQDDVWSPDKLEVLAELMSTRPSTELVFSNARLVDAGGQSLGLSLFDALEIGDRELRGLNGRLAFATLVRRNLVTGTTAVFRRRVLDTALPFPADWIHDEWIAIIAAAIGEVQPVMAELVDYRQHGGNAIGVARPTLRYKLGRLTSSRSARNAALARRGLALKDRLAGAAISQRDDISAIAHGKLEFETHRVSLPAGRLARLPGILRQLVSGGYSRYSSQGNADALRDLLQSV